MDQSPTSIMLSVFSLLSLSVVRHGSFGPENGGFACLQSLFVLNDIKQYVAPSASAITQAIDQSVINFL